MAVGGSTGSERSEDILVALKSASELTVKDEDGHDIEFGSLFKDTKTIIIFVRVRLRYTINTLVWCNRFFCKRSAFQCMVYYYM